MLDRNGDPALVIAVRAGSTGTLDLLLGTRVNVNATTKFGDTALMIAALSGRLELVKKLRREAPRSIRRAGRRSSTPRPAGTTTSSATCSPRAPRSTRRRRTGRPR